MGLESSVTFAEGQVPAWATVHELLTRQGFPVQMRMIDGQLAFPDEMPPEPWHELRVGTAQGQMVTLRRGPDRVALVVWGNAEGPLLQVRNALAWALAEAGGGQVASDAGEQTADEFRRAADLPEALRG
jgi:hypothetical protein